MAWLTASKAIDWHPYLISSGYSSFTRQMMSQVVDTSWGTENWDPVKAGHLLKPFKGKKVLFIQPRNSLSVSSSACVYQSTEVLTHLLVSSNSMFNMSGCRRGTSCRESFWERARCHPRSQMGLLGNRQDGGS